MPGTSGSIGNGILGEYFPEREYNLLGPKKTRKRPKFQPWSAVMRTKMRKCSILTFDLTLTDTGPLNKKVKSALEPSRRDLSNAASPVSLRSLVWELAWES